MPEIPRRQISLLQETLGKIHDKVIYPVSRRGYEHIQHGIGRGIREEGLTLPQAVDRVYDKMGARFQLLPESSSTVDKIRNGAGIFVGNNQDYGANFLYLRALKDRPTDNVYFFEKGASVPYWDESARGHILPVYYDISLEKTHGYLAEKIRNSSEYERIQGLTLEEMRQLNNQTLSDAATRIAEGGLVTIFPSAGGDEEAEWKRGIGDIVQELGNNRPDAQLIMGFTRGTSQWDKYKLAPGVRRIKPMDVRMYVSAVPLSNLLENVPQGADSKIIARHLRDTYREWVSQKKVEEKSVSPQRRPLL